MKFQRFTCYDITEKEIGRTYFTGPKVSHHWDCAMNDPDWITSKGVELIFEEIRAKEFPNLPTRRHCLFLFDLSLNPYFYADSMAGFFPDQLNLVEVELLDLSPKIARVNKSLIGSRIKDGKLNASREEIVADARTYWSGVTQTTLDEEILFSGTYRYTRIIRPPKPLFRPTLVKLDAEQNGEPTEEFFRPD